jgi:hypothetical protein
VLPRSRGASEKRDRAAAYGTLVHHWKETGDEAPAWADPRDVKTFGKRLVLSGVERDVWWPPGAGEHEVTFALNLLTLELLQPPEEAVRDEWKAAFSTPWLTGTIDWLSGSWVDDLKTGNWPVDPVTSKQLRSYSLLPWARAGFPVKWSGLITITQWPKYPLASPPQRTSHEIDGFDMAEHLSDLQWAVDHPDEVNPTEDGCRFCASKGVCPSWVDSDLTLVPINLD